ncbi:MAG: hypothetical protein LBQ55_07460 [Treponema sp.]|jgi:hypothetical protein|nr:hypothetical protein [Treponema sp.]
MNNTAPVPDFISKREKVPSLDETCTKTYGPVMTKIRRRTLAVYFSLCVIGLLPAFLGSFTSLKIPAKLIAVGCGLLVPGGGFIAAGNHHSIVLGMVTIILFFTVGFKTLDMFGDLIVSLLLWLAGGIGGLAANEATPRWAPLYAAAAAVVVWGYWNFRVHKLLAHLKRSRKQRLGRFDAMVQRVNAAGNAAPEPETRELSREAVTASRYLYDLCLEGEGYKNFDKLFFPSLSAYRYQLAYVGYALMTLQCGYTPNFHGYLNEAQRFLIEGYTRPETCGYWKWESLAGYWRWNPDPVIRGNVMLSGWASALIAGYGANTGDLRYEQDRALRFKPFKNSDKTYDHTISSIIESFEKQIQREPAALISCEPQMQFPICNAYALLGMLAYDRAHHTGHAKGIYEKFINSLMQDFCELNGDVVTRRYQLTGLRFTPKTALMGGSFGNIAIAQAYNPIYPGLAKRSYAIVRDELLYIEDGLAYMRDLPWEKVIDMGTGIYSPGSLLSLLEVLALEFGDYEMAGALVAVEGKFLVPSKRRFKFKDVSVCGMANLAAARWNRKNDWFDTILKGPPAAAFSGPLLNGCLYPHVLVAKAFSHGDDLELVLYNGTDEKRQRIQIERLRENKPYLIRETGHVFTADGEGKAGLDCDLDGRTQLTIVPAAGGSS